MISVITLIIIFLSCFLFVKKDLYLCFLVTIINILPIIGIIINENYYADVSIIFLYISIVVCMISFFAKKNILYKKINNIFIKEYDNKIKLLYLITSISFIIYMPSIYNAFGSDYLSFHRGELDGPPVLLEYLYRIFSIICIYYFLFKVRLSNKSYICFFILYGIPTLLYLAAGFRSPFLVYSIAGIFIFFYINPKINPFKSSLKSKFLIGLFFTCLVIIFGLMANIRSNKDLDPSTFIQTLIEEIRVGVEPSNIMIQDVVTGIDNIKSVSFKASCLIFNESMPRLFMRGTYLEIKSLLNGPGECFTFSDSYQPISGDGSGLASSIIADLYYLIGFAFTILVFFLFIITLSLDYLMNSRFIKITIILSIMIVPQLLTLWRAGLYGFSLLDPILIIFAYSLYILYSRSKIVTVI